MKRDTTQPASGAQSHAPEGLAYFLSRQFAGVILRFVAVLRLFALIALASVLLHFSFWEGLVDLSPAKRLVLYALFLINAPITALIWSGAFASKWRCLPAYVICEVGFAAWNLYHYYGTEGRRDSVFLFFVALFLVFFILFIPLIVVRFFRFLREQHVERNNQLYGRVDHTIPESRLISPQSAGVVLRVVAVIRLLCLNFIAAFMLNVCVFYRLRDIPHDKEPQVLVTLYVINAAITALLWSGSFAEMRRCLPVYAICEVVCCAWMVYYCMLFFISEHSLAAFLFFGVPFLVYIPLIVVRYYRFLSERDIERKRHLYGRIEQS